MTPNQITTLAREYAEDMAKGPEFEKLSDNLKENLLELNTAFAAEIFRWLCERFCLVEKDKVEKEYNLALSNFEMAGCARPLRQSYFDGRVDAIKSLFPDLGKEVKNG